MVNICKNILLSFLLLITLQAQSSSKFSDREKQHILSDKEGNKKESSMRILQTTNRSDSLMLRKECLDVDISDPLLKTLIARMSVTMLQNGGVGIAAPQIGILRNVFIFVRVDKMLEFAQIEQERQKEYAQFKEKIKQEIEKEETSAKEKRSLKKRLRIQEKRERAEYKKFGKKIQTEIIEVAINPKIVAHSDSVVCFLGDGCLSIPDVQGNSLRYAWIDVEYYNRHGAKVRERLSGYDRNSDFTAVIFQHEYDHIQGVLFIDKLCVE